MPNERTDNSTTCCSLNTPQSYGCTISCSPGVRELINSRLLPGSRRHSMRFADATLTNCRNGHIYSNAMCMLCSSMSRVTSGLRLNDVLNCSRSSESSLLSSCCTLLPISTVQDWSTETSNHKTCSLTVELLLSRYVILGWLDFRLRILVLRGFWLNMWLRDGIGHRRRFWVSRPVSLLSICGVWDAF